MRRAGAALLLVLLTAGAAACGGSSGPVYAGMTEKAARAAGVQQSQSQTTDTSNDLYGHRLRLLSVTQGHDPLGNPAWQIAFRDFSDYRKPRLCIWFADGQYSGGVLQLSDDMPCPKGH